MTAETRKAPSVPTSVLEEALSALLVRVHWYTRRCFADRDIPEGTRLAFNYLCDVLDKPHSAPWERLRP